MRMKCLVALSSVFGVLSTAMMLSGCSRHSDRAAISVAVRTSANYARDELIFDAPSVKVAETRDTQEAPLHPDLFTRNRGR